MQEKRQKNDESVSKRRHVSIPRVKRTASCVPYNRTVYRVGTTGHRHFHVPRIFFVFSRGEFRSVSAFVACRAAGRIACGGRRYCPDTSCAGCGYGLHTGSDLACVRGDSAYVDVIQPAADVARRGTGNFDSVYADVIQPVPVYITCAGSDSACAVQVPCRSHMRGNPSVPVSWNPLHQKKPEFSGFPRGCKLPAACSPLAVYSPALG